MNNTITLPTPIVKHTPMPHQSIAIENVLNYFSDISNTRGKLNMACGSGKTLTSYWILEQMRLFKNVKNIIITVPNLVLEAQTFNTFYNLSKEEYDFMCVCSDDEVAEEIKVTTNKKEIISFIRNNKKPIIIISTYQSLDVISEACKEIDFVFDFAIIDEAHRTVGNREKSFSKILFDDKIKIKYRLFMTATEKVYVGKDDSIIGMENPAFYGKTIYEYPLSKAISDGVLCDYEIATIYSTSQEIIEFINSHEYINDLDLDLKDTYIKNIMCALLATIRAIREKGCRKIITYHSTIKRAELFKELLDAVISNGILNINTFHINGNYSSGKRSDILDQFQDSFVGILTNSQSLVEGIDIPNVDCIVYVDNKESTIAVIQSIGRALRKHESKRISHVIIPVLVEYEDDLDIENTVFYKLFRTLVSISLMDERVLYEIKQIGLDQSHSPLSYSKRNFKVEGKEDLRQKITHLIKDVSLKIWDKNKDYLPYEDCVSFIKQDDLTKNVKSCNQWERIRKNLPSNIPKYPNKHYAVSGDWKSWRDFFCLGPKKIKNYLTFENFKKWGFEQVELGNISENIRANEWYKLELPEYIPKSPSSVYVEWIGWDYFLKYRGEYASYDVCKKWVNENLPHIKTLTDWNKMDKSILPKFIPPTLEYFSYFSKNPKLPESNKYSLDIKRCLKPHIHGFWWHDFLNYDNSHNLEKYNKRKEEYEKRWALAKKIGERVSIIRKNKNISTFELAELCHGNEEEKYINSFEIGRAYPQLDFIKKISLALDVNILDIITKDEMIILKYKIK